ncbi:MAG: transglycosylase SLT domain-containing protein [Pyrinomonadaceae bacterium]
MSKYLRILMVVLVCVAVVCGQIDATSSSPRSTSREPAAKTSGRLREVHAQSGDTLSAIARRYRISAAELAKLNGLSVRNKLRKGRRLLVPDVHADSNAGAINAGEPVKAVGKRIKLTDGRSLLVDEAWSHGPVVWYTRAGVTQSLDGGVEAIESVDAPGRGLEARGANSVLSTETKTGSVKAPSILIYLVGGARFKVDEVNETSAGAWYSRGTLSVFLARERISRIERIEPGSTTPDATNRDWTSGNANVDELIKINGARYGIDPYLVFCVIEQESNFRSRAVSPKGARGLMQLMPGTARRLGVRRPFDAAENIKGGTQYLRELMDMFGGQVNLVLASYNAGEGAVKKYGRSVPPYRETREYVRRIGKRYGLHGTTPSKDND